MEKGIEIDLLFGNYYNAALDYFYTKDKVWSSIREIFVNMESLTDGALP